ncbi:MAG: Copper binding protein plastocyanin/azurin family [Myxococcales bacterium]|jgi:plastocyanin|nr:Copper binding protein plastocyanin/azurin family [Myxococcales bacterium]
MRTALALIVLASIAGGAEAAPGGRVVGKVTVTEADGKPAVGAEVIVYVVGFAEPPEGRDVVTVQQKGRAFTPDLVAITVGEKIAFPNADAFLHNVFSQSATRKFDLGSFKKGESKTKEFPAPGVVDVYCNIHPEMAATILVLPNRRHTRTAADGTYSISGVPPGTWTVFAYTRRASKPISGKVTVASGADARLDLALQRGAEKEHLNKYGEKYRPNTTTYR